MTFTLVYTDECSAVVSASHFPNSPLSSWKCVHVTLHSVNTPRPYWAVDAFYGSSGFVFKPQDLRDLATFIEGMRIPSTKRDVLRRTPKGAAP